MVLPLCLVNGDEVALRLEESGEGWALAGATGGRFRLVDEYLSHLTTSDLDASWLLPPTMPRTGTLNPDPPARFREGVSGDSSLAS